MGKSPYTREQLAEAIAASANWTDLMRRLGLPENGGRRRTLQRKAAEFELDTSHFKKRSPWKKYPDSAIAAAVKCSTSLREVVNKLGAPPASVGREYPGHSAQSGDTRRRPVTLGAGEPPAEARRRHFTLSQRAPVGTGGRPAACGSPEHQLRGRHARTRPRSQRHQSSSRAAQDCSAEARHRPLHSTLLDDAAGARASRDRADHSRRQTFRLIPHQPHTASPRPAGGRCHVPLCRAATRANGWDSRSRSRSITSTVSGWTTGRRTCAICARIATR